jgi:hypothetical protein
MSPSVALARFNSEDPSSSPTVEPPMPELVKLRVDPGRRDMVVREIVETEKSYLKGLQELCDIYVKGAEMVFTSSTGKKDSVVPARERKAVFGNVVSTFF